MCTVRRAIAYAAISALTFPSAAHSQMTKDEAVTAATALVTKAAAVGEPMDRCALNVVVGDSGRVLKTLGSTSLGVGDRITSINGTLVEGMSPDDFSAQLRKIGPSETVSIGVLHGTIATTKAVQCVNAKPLTAALVSAVQAASKKDFKGCQAQLAAAPTVLQTLWQTQFWATQCGILAHSISAADEPTRVVGWLSGLVDEAQYVQSERATAAQAVQQSESYFRGKGQLALWTKLQASLTARPEVAAAMPAEPDWGKFRSVGEAAIKARLIDPGSAQFEWPWGFIYGTWKPLLAKRIEGYWTCGQVNARNRMGGYIGASAFVVVFDRNGSVEFVDIGSGKEFDLVDTQCAKSVKLLPPAPASMAAAQQLPVASVADELAKLAALRDKGILSESEFQAQKAKLLGEPAAPR